MLRISEAAKTYLLKQRQADSDRLKQARQTAQEQLIAAMPKEERDVLIASAMAKIQAGLRANYYRLRPNLRRMADRLGVMDGD